MQLDTGSINLTYEISLSEEDTDKLLTVLTKKEEAVTYRDSVRWTPEAAEEICGLKDTIKKQVTDND